jgi:NADPH:quinone reductase-like Zn-dependent oxidoreductase
LGLPYLDSVRRQEQDALEVLELPEEDADEGVSVDVVHVALLQEDIGLVQEKDRTPRVADIQYLLELALQVPRVGAQFAGRRHVQRAFEQFRDAFGRQGLAGARRSVEDSYPKVSSGSQTGECEGFQSQHTDEALALALDDVVNALGGVVLVRFDECLPIW